MYRDLQSDSKTFQFPSPPAHHELLRTKRDAWRQTSDCVLFSVLFSVGAFGISSPQLHWGCAHYSCAMGTPLLPLGLGSHFPRSQQTWGDCIHERDHEMRFQLMEGRGFHSCCAVSDTKHSALILLGCSVSTRKVHAAKQLHTKQASS